MEQSRKNVNIWWLAAVILVLAGFAVLWAQNRSLSQKITGLQKTSVSQDDLAAAQRMQNNSLVAVTQAARPLISKNADVLYLPELRIQVPYSRLASSLLYSLRDEEGDGNTLSQTAETDVRTSFYTYPEKPTRIDCGDEVRLKFEASPHPYNPHEKPTSVKLDDGRTLQIYELVNEPECTDTWNRTINPSELVAIFKEATPIK
jgi:hypothetical protein